GAECHLAVVAAGIGPGRCALLLSRQFPQALSLGTGGGKNRMYARMESVQRTGQPRLDLRLVGGLLGTLLVGVTAGYLAATLNPQGSSQTLTRTPAASVAAPSGGVYGDRDSRLPYQATAGAWGDHDSRLPIASAASISLGDAWGDRDSRLPYLASLDAA